MPIAELDAALGRKASVALDHAVLHLDGAAHGVDHATKLDDAAVAGALDHAPMMHGDGGIDQIASERRAAAQGPLLVGAGKPAVSDHIRRKNGCEFPGLRHGSPFTTSQTSTIARRTRQVCVSPSSLASGALVTMVTAVTAICRPLNSHRASGTTTLSLGGCMAGACGARPST